MNVALNSPPPAIVALMRESNSSSPRMASCKWRGVIRFTFKSLEALPANSRTCGGGAHGTQSMVCIIQNVGSGFDGYQQKMCRNQHLLQRWGTRGWQHCTQLLWLRRDRGWLYGFSSVCGYDPLGTAGCIQMTTRWATASDKREKDIKVHVLRRTYLQPCSLRAGHGFSLGLAAVFSCLATSLESATGEGRGAWGCSLRNRPQYQQA